MATRLTLFLFIQCCSCVKLPVLVIDTTENICFPTSVNPFKDTPQLNFTRYVLDALRKSDNIIVFVEKKFSVEDVSSRDSLGTPFNNIHELFLKQRVQYMPRVNNPVKTLEKLLPPKETEVVHLNENELRILNKNIKYYFVHFAETEDYLLETRVQRLRRHDAYIKQMYGSLKFQRSGAVLVFYTGKTNPMMNVKQYDQPRTPNETKPLMVVTDQALLWLSGVVKQDGPKKAQLENAHASTRSVARSRTSTRVAYDDDLEIEFEFKFQEDSWLLENVILLEGGEEVGRTRMSVGARYGQSYFCSEPIIIGNTRDKSYITIAKYQVEPQPQSHLENLELGEDYKDDFYLDVREGPRSKLEPSEQVIQKARQKIVRALADHGIEETPRIVEHFLKYLLSKNNYQVERFDDSGAEPDVDDDRNAETTTESSAATTESSAATTESSDSAPDKDGKKEPETNLTNNQFCAAVTCGTNFNGHILAGLFVAALVMSIASCGIIVLMDCGVNDRMDDPTKKPLVIIEQR